MRGTERGLALRKLRADDREFLERLYAATRAEEMALVDWTDDEKAAFLRMQFEAQHRYYQEAFVGARFDIIEREGRPVGRLYVDRRADEIRVIDIALLPQERGAGIGRTLMQSLLDEAAETNRSVRIHVERHNRAMRLYERLGFVVMDDDANGVYRLMEWSPPTRAASTQFRGG